MRHKWLAVLGLAFLAAQAGAAAKPVLKTEKDKVSYAMGVDMARGLKQQEVDVNPDALVRGLQDALAGRKLLMDEEDIKQTRAKFVGEVRRKQYQARLLAGEKNKAEGDAFLAANKTQEGVVTLESGLQYKILKAGEGRKPTAEDTVEVNYRGSFVNGTEFDSSYSRGQPATISLKEAIPAWREALQLMPVGSTWQLFVHPRLAYGERGLGPVIGPNATLIFEVELLGIK